MLANLITLTPGSVSLDVSSDRRFLYFHAMYIDDVEKYREIVKTNYRAKGPGGVAMSFPISVSTASTSACR